jgi:hypothetical protein
VQNELGIDGSCAHVAGFARGSFASPKDLLEAPSTRRRGERPSPSSCGTRCEVRMYPGRVEAVVEYPYRGSQSRVRFAILRGRSSVRSRDTVILN